MLFNSLSYLFLLALSIIGSHSLKRYSLVIIIFSLIFYYFAGLFDLAILTISVFTNWLISRCICCKTQKIIIASLFNIGLLCLFKYFRGFIFIDAADINLSDNLEIALPIGISFYTFQMLSYQVDLARGHTKPANSFLSFLGFVAFFPQVIAGPIVRAKQFLPQIEILFLGKKPRKSLFNFGFSLLLLGIFKKSILADSVAPVVEEIFYFGPQDIVWAWLGCILFSFQIYFDFSGYSDMAVGSAIILGFRIPFNFKTPYLSNGPQEFWRRWHITLSNWIRDYLYIPIGGNKKNLLISSLIIISTMTIAGIWHGAGLNFLVWGLAWGIYILLGRLLRDIKLPRYFGIPFTFTIVSILWVLFRTNDLEAAADYYLVLFALSDGISSNATFYKERNILNVLLVTCFVFGLFHWIEFKLQSKIVLKKLIRSSNLTYAAMTITILIMVALIPNNNDNPFIYFRF